MFFLVTNPIVPAPFSDMSLCHILCSECPHLLMSLSVVLMWQCFVIIDCYFLLCRCILYFPVVVDAENKPGIYNSFLSLSCEKIFATLLIFILCVRVFYLHICLCATCIQCLQSQKRVSFGIGVTDDCELCGC